MSDEEEKTEEGEGIRGSQEEKSKWRKSEGTINERSGAAG